MAFLCPIRVKRTKKKKPLDDESLPGGGAGPAPSMGRITGSASIETLVRVGIEKENGLGPESKMVVLHDFTPCVDDELEVKRGQIVHVLYQENDWVYVISSEDNQEGFIPHSYCAQFGSQLAGLALNEAEAKQSKRSKKKLPRDPSTGFQGGGGDGQHMSQNTGLPQTMMATAQVPASSSTSTASSTGGGAMASLRTNLSEKNITVGSNMSAAEATMMGASNEVVINNRLANNNVAIASGNHSQQVMDFRSLNAIGKVGARSNSKTSTNSAGKGVEIGHSDDTGGEDDSFEPREGSIRVAGTVGNGGGRQSGVFRGVSQNDPSRSNSLMSETSSQPDMHPFFKEATGRYIVLYNYTAQDENDLTVERGQCVTVLNCDDADWYWVSQFDGRDGFVPSGFIYPLDAIQRQQGMNDVGQHHRGTMPSNNFRGPFGNYPDTSSHNQFSSNLMISNASIATSKGGNATRMFQGQQKITSGSGFQSGHIASQQSSNVLHQINNINSSHQQQFNPPWSNGSAGSSGPPSFNNNSVSFAQSNSNVSGIFSATAANAVQTIGVSNNSVAGDLLHLGVGSSAATFSAINQAPSLQHSNQSVIAAAPSPQKPTPISSTSSTSGNIVSGSSRQQSLSTHPSMSPVGSHVTNSTVLQGSGGPSSMTSSSAGEVCYNGTELVMLYDYKAQAPDDLSVRRGDWVYADLNNQTVDGWLWSYAPKTRKYGFIPKAYARPPAMTSL